MSMSNLRKLIISHKEYIEMQKTGKFRGFRVVWNGKFYCISREGLIIQLVKGDKY